MSNTKNAYALAEEPFYTIQGEGYNAGRAAVFIRFSRCNLNCSFCDTEFNKVVGVYTAEEIRDKAVELIKEAGDIYPRQILCVFTGGEPFQQLNEKIMVAMYDAGFAICVESNGTVPFEGSEDRHDLLPVPTFLTLSPKYGHPAIWDTCSEIKVVIDGKQNPYEAVCNKNGDIIDHTYGYVQACSEDYPPAVEFVKQNPCWRLSVQTQKVMKIQ
jgi:organic radical activating enzyme